MIHGVPLESADVQRVIHHVPAAAGLAGVLADVGAGGGGGIALPFLTIHVLLSEFFLHLFVEN